MRRMLSCVLMMTLLLTACGGGGKDDPRELAAQIRGEYLNMTGWSAVINLTADYGERVFDFTVDARWEKDGETVLTVTKPELVAGITARIEDGEARLEYDGAGLSIGALDEEGLNPVSAVPVLMEQITGGYMAQCVWEGEGEGRLLRIQCRHPDKEEQEGTEYTLWFQPATHALVRAEVSVGGELRLTAVLTDFYLEMKDDDTGDHENLG